MAKLEKVCQYCGKKFWVWKSEASERKYCSRRCFGLAKRGVKNPFYGKHHTEEARKKVSEGNKGNKNALGTHRSEETKRKLSLAHRRFS